MSRNKTGLEREDAEWRAWAIPNPHLGSVCLEAQRKWDDEKLEGGDWLVCECECFLFFPFCQPLSFSRFLTHRHTHTHTYTHTDTHMLKRSYSPNMPVTCILYIHDLSPTAETYVTCKPLPHTHIHTHTHSNLPSEFCRFSSFTQCTFTPPSLSVANVPRAAHRLGVDCLSLFPGCE